jgi:hypothetical protein
MGGNYDMEASMSTLTLHKGECLRTQNQKHCTN